MLGLNLMVAMENYEQYAKAAVEAGIDIIISGAGLPLALPEYTKIQKQCLHRLYQVQKQQLFY